MSTRVGSGHYRCNAMHGGSTSSETRPSWRRDFPAENDEDGRMPDDELIRSLYCLPPAEFGRHRDRALTDAQRDGRHDVVLSLSKLRRPSAGSWLVNRLAAEHPQEIAELAAQLAVLDEVGCDEPARADALNRYYAGVARLVEAARMLAYRARAPLGAEITREVQATLLAPLDDRDTLAMVRAGLVTGPLGRPDSPHPAAARRRLRSVPTGSAGRQRSSGQENPPAVPAAQQDADAAEEVLRAAAARHARATTGVMDAAAALEHAETAVRAARERLAAARREALTTRRGLTEARAQAEAARRRTARLTWARSG